MRTKKAVHMAMRKSLDGHCRFVVKVGGTVSVFTLHDFAQCPQARIEVAYYGGRAVVPR